MADDFNNPTLDASPCELTPKIPSLPGLSISIPGISTPSLIPSFNPTLSISCQLNKPVDVSEGLSWGGGRVAEFDPDPDDEQD